jgi:uncharacterized protein with beta-barrel porin domain
VGDGTPNNVAVTVQPGASITLGNDASDVWLNDGNVIINNGTITAGNSAFGIRLGNNNVVTNNGALVLGNGVGILTVAASATANTGTVFVVNGGVGIEADGDGSSIVNSGSVTIAIFGTGLDTVGNNARVVNSGSVTLLGTGNAIFVGGDNSAVTNSGSVTIGGGGGISTLGVNSGIVNSGAVNVKLGGTALATRGANSAIINSHAITVVNGFGIRTEGANSGISNSGLVSASGTGVFGIETLDVGSAVVNSGTVQMSGANDIGIFTHLDNSSISNGGAISLTGDGSIGLRTNGIGSAISNSGVVTVAGMNAIGIQTNAANSGISNSGTVTMGGAGAFAIQTLGLGSAIVNSGTVQTTGINGAGLFTQADNTAITNIGMVTVGGDQTFAIRTAGVGSAIFNSGTVQAAGVNSFGLFTAAGNIFNSGTVLAPHGVGIEAVTGGVTIVNSGVVRANVSVLVASGNDTVTNTGVLDGALTIVNSGNAFTNSGVVTITTTDLPVAPFHSVGGTFTQTAAGTLAERVTNGGAHDGMRVTGTANLDGMLGAMLQPGLYANATTFRGVLSATSPLTSRFAQTAAFAAGATSPLAFFTVTPTYNANSVDITLNRVPFGAAGGETQNQRNVGNALESAYATTLTGAPANLFGILLQSTSLSVLTQASGEAATGAQQTTFQAMTQFLGTMLDPLIGGRGDGPASATGAAPFAEDGDAADAYASTGRKHKGSEREAYGMITKAVPRNPVFDPHWSVWAAGFGGSQSTDGNAALGSNDTTSRVFGVAAGADYLVSPRTIAGFALAGGGTNFSVANNTGTGHSDLFQAGAFVRHTVGPLYISAALAYGWQDVTTDRTVTIAGVDQLRAHFNANAFSGRVEGGYRFVTPWIGGLGITPYAAGQFTTFDLPAYAESVLSGANMFALSYASKSVTASRSELGLRTDKSYALESAILTLRSRLAWAHDFSTDRSVAATFQTLPGAGFVVNGAVQAHDSALTTASAEMKWLNGVSLAAAFEGEFSDVTKSYAGKGVARYQW